MDYRVLYLELRKKKLEIAMIMPLFIYIIGLTLIPVITTVGLGFKDIRTGEFTLKNYKYIFGQPDFLNALINTLLIAVISVALQLTVGLILALILNKAFNFKGFFRTIFLIPMGVPTIVSGVVMSYVFSTTGYLNELLYRLGLIKVPIEWASGGINSILTIAVADTWKVTPLITLILLAGLQSISEDVYEAAAIDGASTWQTFKNVTLPLLKPAITTALIMRMMDSLRIFELVLVITGQSTPVLGTYAFNEYSVYNNPNTAGAASTILTVIIFLFVVVYLRTAGKGSDAE